jgi:hypothetical protein
MKSLAVEYMDPTIVEDTELTVTSIAGVHNCECRWNI